MQCNPGLTKLIASAIGDGFLDDFEQLLEGLAAFADDAGFQERFAAVKRANKAKLANLIGSAGRAVDPDALFDVQVKRIHEYKRQLLNILETVALYDADPGASRADWVPRVKIFAGKAAPSYGRPSSDHQADQRRGKVVNNDPAVRDLLKVVFLPNYNVSAWPRDHPGGRPVRADLDRRHGGLGHRQHEVRAQRRADHRHARRRQCRNAEHVGAENIFIFGLTAEEVEESGARLSAAAVIEASPPRSRRRSTRSPRACSRPTIRNRYRAWSAASTITTGSWWPPISTPMPPPSGGRQLWRNDPADGARNGDPQHRAHGLVLVRPHDPAICRR
jgi:starch phosphorylase